MTANVTPWWDALRLRAEIVDASGAIDDVQMSIHDAVYGRGAQRPAYASPLYYGDITHPTGQLVDLLTKLAVRMGGGDDYLKAPALIRLDQGMGGGKSHACVGAWLLAEQASEFAKTDIGKAVRAQAQETLGRTLLEDLGRPRVVVLPCDSMTPGAPVQELDGPARNLWERFLWRLFDKDYARYENYRPYFNDRSRIIDALRSVGRPVLIIVDEILNYVGNGLDGAGDPELVAQDMGFIRVLLDAVNDVPHVAMLLVMIASDKDTIALSPTAVRRRDELTSLIDRNGRPATVTENADFASILRRRLFDQPPVKEVVDATIGAFDGVMHDKGWRAKVLELLGARWVSDFDAQIARSYPFHPQLMELAESEWANLAGFQKVRSTIRVFAAAVWALQKRGKAGGWVPLLIGPGDLLLSDNTVRESILGSGLIADQKTQANYRSLAQNDIVALDDTTGTSRSLDLRREAAMWGHHNPRAAERAATMVFLASIVGARGQGRRGASEAEAKAATIVPTINYGIADADGVIGDLTHPETGLASVEPIAGKGGQSPRLYLSTRQTLTMLSRAARGTVSDTERDATIANEVDSLSSSGPFRNKLFVRADHRRTAIETLAIVGLDDARTTRLVILDPAAFSLRNGLEEGTLAALNAALGIGQDKFPATWASSLVFAVVNTQRRGYARNLATEYLARKSVLAAPEVQADEAMLSKATSDLAEARRRMQAAIRHAFQHVVFLSQPDADAERELAQVTFNEDNQTSLNGELVWKALVESEKAFDSGDFTATVLLHQLRDDDYGRPLSELRDAFWQAPRLPLLHDGEREIQKALYDAVQAGSLRVAGRDGSEVAVTGPTEINLSSTTLTIAKPTRAQPTESEDTGAETYDPGNTTQGSAIGGAATSAKSPPTGVSDPGGRTEKQVTLSVLQRFDDEAAMDDTAAMLRVLYEIIERSGASFMSGQLRVIVDEKNASDLTRAAQAAGVTFSVQDQ